MGKQIVLFGYSGIRYRWSEADKQKMADMYLAGHSTADLVSVFGGSMATIAYHLKRRGVQLRPQGTMTPVLFKKRSGANHHYWKGGRKVSTGGYQEVRCPDHPCAQNGYVLEHRLIMERHLKQTAPEHPALDQNGYLLQYWVVHHKNGNKLDNRIENLEPLPRSQHHSWIHYKDELEAVRRENAELKALLNEREVSNGTL